jgi:hypothetical protein
MNENIEKSKELLIFCHFTKFSAKHGRHYAVQEEV